MKLDTQTESPSRRPRTVTVNIDSEAIGAMKMEVGDEPLFETLGYLSTWDQDYQHVAIYRERGTDLRAVYEGEGTDGRKYYTIEAAWDGTKYTFKH